MDEHEHAEWQLAGDDPYAVLGVSPESTPSEIRGAYFALVRAHPPERDPEGFKRIRAAYDQLRSPRKRAELTLLELRQSDEEFDLGRLHDAPAPAFPAQWLDHLIAIALAGLDAEIDAMVAAKKDAILQRYRREERT
ncbi:MAG: hypothetical protein EPO21_16875 [Chloroflexota bacterium]|nr:MAG: hypothetical protein EPO21_16875 [Chloroflexota bacterium]